MAHRLALLALVLLVAPALADQTPVKKPIGTWQREADSHKITFVIKADSLTVRLENSSKVEAKAACAMTADGVLFGIITAVDRSDNGPDKGDLFSFRVAVDGKQLTVSELNGTKVNDNSRKIIEGSYTRKE